MTRIETALVRILLGAQEAGDHNARCIDTGCPVAAELADVAERGLAALVGVALTALVEAAEAWRDFPDIPAGGRIRRAVDAFRAATEPQTKWAETGPGSMHDIVMGATEHSAMTTPEARAKALAEAAGGLLVVLPPLLRASVRYLTEAEMPYWTTVQQERAILDGALAAYREAGG